MKVVILAGGVGARISEESHLRPKPLIEIGTHPMLWHLMRFYASFGYDEFIVCAGYKQEMICAWTACAQSVPWKVTVVDTGLDTMTGGRVKRIAPLLDNEPFFLTYADGLCSVDLNKELAFHRAHGKAATVLAVHPEPRFGVLSLDGERVIAFREKSRMDLDWINGGFMILNPCVLERIQGDTTVLESEVMESLCRDGELMAYRHDGFWQCMDTMRDKERLEELWSIGNPPWIKEEQ